MLPNFLIIGVPRSATTFLQRCIAEHHEAYMLIRSSYSSGDVHFFNPDTNISYEKNFEKGIGWYEKLFDNVKNEKAIGEKTAHYLLDTKAPELIRKHIPNVKMVAILRNPIERAYSDFWYHKGEISSKMDFLEACYSVKTRRLKLIEAGFYYRQIARYLNFFNRSQFRFIIYDDLLADPLKCIQDVYQFLEINQNYVPSLYNKKINVGISDGLSFYLRIIGGTLKQKFPGVFKTVRLLPGVNLIDEEIGKKRDVESENKQYADMTTEARQELSKIYYKEDQKLSSFLRRDLVSLWHNNVD